MFSLIFKKFKQNSKTSKIILIFYVFLFFTSDIFGALLPQKRAERLDLRTSIAIPCCGKHFQHLNPLLQYYVNQTQLPDEVIISLSDVEQILQEELDSLEHKSWPFVLKIIKKEGRESAGQNRNIAASHCTSDVILFQDADDVPHPQRVEIVKFVFENYQVDHLMHLWLGPQCQFTYYAPKELELIHLSNYSRRDVETIHIVDQGWQCSVHNGNICLTKEVTQYNKWESVFGYDKDVEFNISIYDQPLRTFVLRAPLLIYRNELSSFK